MKTRVKILKPVQSYIIGNVYRLSGHFADKLIKHGKAVKVLNVKEEKKVIETKEEKFIPETKNKNYVQEEMEGVLPISRLRIVIPDLSTEILQSIVEKDERKSAQKLAYNEIKKRMKR